MIREETRDINVRQVQYTAAGLVILLLLIGWALMTYHQSKTKNYDLIEKWPPVTPRTQGEFESGRIRQQLETEEKRNLESYSGIQSSQAWVQVPIQRAMEQLLEQKTTDPNLLFSNPGGQR